MPLTINTLKVLNEYLTGVMGRADHHGLNVNEVVLAVVGAIIWKVTDDDIEVRTYSGQTANVLWMTLGSNRYALCYNSNNETIELRDRTINGNVLASFENSTSIADIKTIFNRL